MERHVIVVLGGETIADASWAYRVLETSHPPTWYLPPESFRTGALRPAAGSSVCEWKGRAAYLDIVGGGGTIAARAAWTYPDPTKEFASLEDHVALYAGMVDGCFVDGERVVPQPGGFYGGWITKEFAGPFKEFPVRWGGSRSNRLTIATGLHRDAAPQPWRRTEIQFLPQRRWRRRSS